MLAVLSRDGGLITFSLDADFPLRHRSNVWNDKVAVWRISGLSRGAELTSCFVTSLCFPDYAPEYGMSDLNGDCVAFLGREHETPVISVTNWRGGDDGGEYEQAKFRPDFSPVIPVRAELPLHVCPPLTLRRQESEPLRVQGIKLVPPHVLVVAGPVVALFQIPAFERVKHLCGEALRLQARQIHRFDARAHILMGDFVGIAQNPPLASPSSFPPQPITILTSRARITLQPDAKEDGYGEALYALPPTVSRLRAWTHRATKPVVVGSSGTRGVWIQRPTGIKPRLIAWTAARDGDTDVEHEEQEPAPKLREEHADMHEVTQAEIVTAETGRWPRSGTGVDGVTQGWNGLPRGRARKVELYPVKVEDVKRIAFDEGTGRTCLGMRNGEVHVLDFA
jgi:hypothetical protein